MAIELLLAELLATASFVSISQDREDLSYAIVVYSETTKPLRRSVVHQSLEMGLQELVHGKVATHRCSGPCGLDKPLSQFYRYRAGKRLGQTPATRLPWYCLECERTRVREYARARRERNKSHPPFTSQ